MRHLAKNSSDTEIGLLSILGAGYSGKEGVRLLQFLESYILTTNYKIIHTRVDHLSINFRPLIDLSSGAHFLRWLKDSLIFPESFFQGPTVWTDEIQKRFTRRNAPFMPPPRQHLHIEASDLHLNPSVTNLLEKIWEDFKEYKRHSRPIKRESMMKVLSSLLSLISHPLLCSPLLRPALLSLLTEFGAFNSPLSSHRSQQPLWIRSQLQHINNR